MTALSIVIVFLFRSLQAIVPDPARGHADGLSRRTAPADAMMAP
jgi:hypothetical protein